MPETVHLVQPLDVRALRTITVVGAHAGGEIGNVVVGGVLPPPGATVFEQMQSLQRDGDALRRLLLREPRGSVAVHANLIVPATRDDCDAGFIIMEPTEYPAMSGSNTICVATVLLETGMVAMREPETTLRLEALRRGYEDRALLQRAAVCHPDEANALAAKLVPCALGDAKNAAAWPTDEAVWEAARRKLLGLASCGDQLLR